MSENTVEEVGLGVDLKIRLRLVLFPVTDPSLRESVELETMLLEALARSNGE